MSRYIVAFLSISIAVIVMSGCGPTGKTPHGKSVSDDIAAERAKLSVEDKALVESQEWCAVSNDERLGSMGAPVKLMLKGQPVFLCCKNCTRRAEADPDKTLAKVIELKAKSKKGG